MSGGHVAQWRHEARVVGRERQRGAQGAEHGLGEPAGQRVAPGARRRQAARPPARGRGRQLAAATRLPGM